MTVDERVRVAMPMDSDRMAVRGPALIASLRGMIPAVVGGAAIIAVHSIFTPAAAVHQWVLVVYSLMLWLLVPAMAAAAVVAGVAAHRKVTVTPLHSALIFGTAAAVWMMLGVSNLEGALYGLVLGAGAVAASVVLRRTGPRRSAIRYTAVVVAVTAVLLSAGVPTASSALAEALAGLELPIA